MVPTEPNDDNSGIDLETGYRPIASLAIASIVLAVASLLAFAAPFFWVLGFLSLAVSIFASAKLEAAKREYAGQVIAKAAILISLISSIGAPTRYAVEWYILAREASNVAADYVDAILANQVKKAFVLTLTPGQRGDANLADPKVIDRLLVKGSATYRTFLGSDIVQELKSRLAETQITRLPPIEWGVDQNDQFYYIAFLMNARVNEVDYKIGLLLKGAIATGGEWKGRQWYIDSANLRKTN